jgi:hypothetical protein
MNLYLLKAHVAAYTRKDGTYVRKYDDSRPAAASKGAAVRPAANDALDAKR